MASVSIIVPVYKVEEYLKRCVDSILNQTFKDYELILVDDGSPDNCPKMCDEFAEKYSQIKVIHQKNGGLSAARNTGIEWVLANSDSEWITFIDSDDWIHPQYLESLYEANKVNKTDISFGYDMIAEKYIVKNESVPKNEIYSIETEAAFIDKRLDSNAACSRLFRKYLFEDIRFPIGKLHEDRFTSYKAYFKVNKVSVVPFPVYYYFVNDTGIVHSEWSVGRMDDLEAAENQLEFFKTNNYDKAFVHILKEYIHLMIVSLRYLKSHKSYDKYEKIIKKKLRKTLKNHNEELGMSFKNDFNTYKYAYPIRAKIYNRIKILLRK